MADDVLLNKAATIERCLRRVREVHAADPALADLTRQDSVVLNLQRAAQASIDLAMHIVRRDGLGVPQESRDAFRLLIDAGRLGTPLGEAMMRMVGFRNVAVHDYQALQVEIVQAIIRGHLQEIEAFAAWALRQEAV